MTATACDDPSFCIFQSQTNSEAVLTAENRRAHVPITVRLSVTGTNITVTGAGDAPVVVPPGERRVLARVHQEAPGRWKYTYKRRWIYGDYRARPDGRWVLLPWKGQSLRVGQSCHGEFSHAKGMTHAIDFPMPEGTAILAVRGGIVFKVVERHREGGADPETYRGKDNRALILHADGTIGGYRHFRHLGVDVSVGTRVAAGQRLGWSGNTGWSTRPHLHLEVYHANEHARAQSVPVVFRHRDGQVSCPERGTMLTPR